jgi:hypothetical protein
MHVSRFSWRSASTRVVMEIVGRSAMEMTMNVYGHMALDAQREALDKLNDLLER